MTENKAFKKAIRQRMKETGEPYTLARRKLLEEDSDEEYYEQLKEDEEERKYD